MKKNLFLIAMATIWAAASCSVQRPVSVAVPANNNSYKVEYLFEHEGCRVYRFEDGSRYVYFTNCQGEAIHVTDSTTTRNTTRIIKN